MHGDKAYEQFAAVAFDKIQCVGNISFVEASLPELHGHGLR